MRGKTYRVHLTAEEKRRLEDIVSKGVHPARQVRRARILLLLDEGEGPEGARVKTLKRSEIAGECHCNTAVVNTVSKQ
jgi:hypothetical protein